MKDNSNSHHFQNYPVCFPEIARESQNNQSNVELAAFLGSKILLNRTQFFLLVLIFASLQLFLFPRQCLNAPLTLYLAPLLLISEFLRLFYSSISLLIRFISCFLSGGPITGTTVLFEPGSADSLGRGGKIQVSIYPLKNQSVKPVF